MPLDYDKNAEQQAQQCYGKTSDCNGTTSAFLSEDQRINEIFSYHAPDHIQLMQIERVRETAKFLARTILTNVPAGPDRTCAIRKLRECLMTANAAIILRGLSV